MQAPAAGEAAKAASEMRLSAAPLQMEGWSNWSRLQWSLASSTRDALRDSSTQDVLRDGSERARRWEALLDQVRQVLLAAGAPGAGPARPVWPAAQPALVIRLTDERGEAGVLTIDGDGATTAASPAWATWRPAPGRGGPVWTAALPEPLARALREAAR